MESGADEDVARTPVYDVVLTSSPPESVRRCFPTMTVRGVPTQTALRRELSGPEQLDELLETMSEMRIPLADVHLLPTASGAGPTYEVRVDGEVGEPLLHHLNWSYSVVPSHARVRVVAAAWELLDLLRACTESGSTIERVRLVTADEGSRTV